MVTTSIANVFAFITLTGNTELAKSILPPTSLTLVKNTKSPVLLPCAVADTVTVLALNATVKALDTVTDTDTDMDTDTVTDTDIDTDDTESDTDTKTRT